MTPDRYIQADEEGSVTAEELANGWHFCCELDYALDNIANTYEFCDCLRVSWVYRVASAWDADRFEDTLAEMTDGNE